MADIHVRYCQVLTGIARGQGSLGSLLDARTREEAGAQAALLQQWCYGVCRWYHRLDAIAGRLLEKPLRGKDQDVHCLLLLGLFQLYFMRTPDHAVLNETVAATDALRKPWAKGLVNAVLREAQRSRDELSTWCEKDYSVLYSHPQWLLDQFKRDWPRDYRAILDANNHPGPMTLRVNRLRQTRDGYLALLQAAGIDAAADALCDTAITLASPQDVQALPGFADGDASVQDAASQLVSTILPVTDAMRVLDACAAPGGKTCALLERHPGLQVTAIDADATRLVRMHDNLRRLGLHADVRQGDLTQPHAWQPHSFDAVMVDAPCSGTGVIRRHPDIKLLRTPADVAALLARQAALLDAAWPLVATGGHLLYSTCSTLRDENDGQMDAFVARHPDAHPHPPAIAGAHVSSSGAQLFPRPGGHDGFYYALLQKY